MTGRRLAPAAILVLALAGYGFLLRPGLTPYSPFSDFLAFGVGSRTVQYRSARGGGLPFWREDELSGTAALADPSGAYASPLNALFWLFPPLRAFGPTLWLYFLAAGAVGYAAGLALELGLEARLLTGAASMFQFKLLMLAYAGWLISVPSAVVFPLLFIAAWRARRDPGPRSAVLVGSAGAVCLLSGQPQLPYDSALLLAAFGAWSAARPRDGASRRAAPMTLAAGAALAAGLSACVLVPLALDAPLLSRGRASYAFFLSGHGLTPRHLLTFLSPEILGTPRLGGYPELWEDVAYFGLAPLLLAAAGVALAWRRPPTRPLAAAFLASTALALRSPLQRALFEFLPGFRLFRLPGRFLFLASFFGIALAGLGLDEILRRLRGRVRAPVLAAGVAALIALVAGEGAVRARRYLAMRPSAELEPDAGLRDFFARRPGAYRIAPIGRGVFNPGWAAPLGVRLATGYDSYNYSRYQVYMDLLRWGSPQPEGGRVWTDVPFVARPDLLDVLGVKYLVVPAGAALPRDRFTPAARLRGARTFVLYRGFGRGDVDVYENRLALPRAFFAERILLAPGPDEAVSLARRAGLRGAAVVEAGAAAPVWPPGPGDRVEVVSARGGRLELDALAAGPRYLVVAEVWHPGWSASLDGRALALARTDVALLGAWVPAGRHRISLRFRPPGWDAGLAVSALAAALCAALWARDRL